MEWVCCYCQGHQEETPVAKSGEAKSPEATEQNGEEAHRAEGLRAQISLGERRRKPNYLINRKYGSTESTSYAVSVWNSSPDREI